MKGFDNNSDVTKREILRLPAKVAKTASDKKKRARVKIAKSQPKEKVDIPAVQEE